MHDYAVANLKVIVTSANIKQIVFNLKCCCIGNDIMKLLFQHISKPEVFLNRKYCVYF